MLGILMSSSQGRKLGSFSHRTLLAILWDHFSVGHSPIGGDGDGGCLLELPSLSLVLVFKRLLQT